MFFGRVRETRICLLLLRSLRGRIAVQRSSKEEVSDCNVAGFSLPSLCASSTLALPAFLPLQLLLKCFAIFF